MHYLGLCCIVKDETPFLKEWIAFHTLMGVEAFIIYDNDSEESVEETLYSFIPGRFVTVLKVPGRAKQIPCYNHCLETFGKSFAWLGFVDLDEFAVPVKHGDLRLMLSRYEAYAGLGVHWMPFGSNGHKTRPQGLQIEAYTQAMPTAEPQVWHVKLFVQPSRIRSFVYPHFAMTESGYHIVNSVGDRIRSPLSHPPHWDVCQLNHYYYRSNQDFFEKLKKPMADNLREHHLPERLMPPHGDVTDMSAARFAPQVRALLEGDKDCARFAARLRIPESPEKSVALFSDLLQRGQPREALIVLAKAKHQLAASPLWREIVPQAEVLAQALGL